MKEKVFLEPCDVPKNPYHSYSEECIVYTKQFPDKAGMILKQYNATAFRPRMCMCGLREMEVIWFSFPFIIKLCFSTYWKWFINWLILSADLAAVLNVLCKNIILHIIISSVGLSICVRTRNNVLFGLGGLKYKLYAFHKYFLRLNLHIPETFPQICPGLVLTTSLFFMVLYVLGIFFNKTWGLAVKGTGEKKRNFFPGVYSSI